MMNNNGNNFNQSNVIGMQALVRQKTFKKEVENPQPINQVIQSEQKPENFLKEINCPHCNAVNNVKTNQQNEVGQFYKQANCQSCQKKYYFLLCHCKQIITNKITFMHGSFIKCTSPACQYKTIQIFMCPFPECLTPNLFLGDYNMGGHAKCSKCTKTFQQVGCPSCKLNNYFFPQQGNIYKQGNSIQCVNCKFKFYHYNCPYCIAPLFITQEKQPDAQVGCYNCQKMNFQMTCPNKQCNNCIVIKKDDGQIKQAVTYICAFCQKFHKYYQCIHCQNKNLISSEINEKDFGDQICLKCNKPTKFVECPTCKIVQRYSLENRKDKVNEYKCTTCPELIKVQFCKKCQTTFTYKGEGIEQIGCPQCKDIIKIVQNVDQEAQLQLELSQKLSISEDSSIGEKYLCKICINKKADHIFQKCGHLVSCIDCIKDLKDKCPLCRQESKPLRIFI